MKPNYTMLGCAEIMKDSARKMLDASKRLFNFGDTANCAAKVEKYPHGSPDLAFRTLQCMEECFYQYKKALEEDDLETLITLLDEGKRRKEEVDG